MAGVYLEVGFTVDRPGSFVSVPGESIRLGRADECDVRIDSDLVSRRHVELSLIDGRRWVARDLGSSNGTLLNDRQIAEAEVRPHDVLRLGEGGPRVRVIVLNPAPGENGDPDDLEATRYFRVSKPEGETEPEYAVTVKGQDPPIELESTDAGDQWPAVEPIAKEPEVSNDASRLQLEATDAADPPRPPPPKPRLEPPPRRSLLELEQTDAREPTAPTPKPKAKAEPKRPQKRKAHPRKPALAPAPRRPWPLLMILGLGFGAATGLAVWPADFPYDIVAAPSLWASYGIGQLLPTLAAKPGWLLTVVLAAYWGSVGLALRHIRRGYPWLMVLALAHALAYFNLERFGA